MNFIKVNPGTFTLGEKENAHVVTLTQPSHPSFFSNLAREEIDRVLDSIEVSVKYLKELL